MGKSIRSKSKLRAKTIKRKGEFTDFVDARNKRIADKMEKHAKEQAEAKSQSGEDIAEMDIAENDKPKEDKNVSTSGWRDSRKQIYKQRKIKAKKSKTLKF